MNDREMLHRLGHMLTAPGRDRLDVLPAAAALCELMERRSSLPSPAGTTLGAGSTLLDSGLALSAAEAALCAHQPLRTIVFVRALLAAIEMRAAEAAGPVRVLYAGCGPYAPLALPLMAILGPAKAVFTLLDIHAASIGHVRALVADLGLSECVEGYVQADATRHRIDPARPPDVIVTETMNAALRTEPQVAIARHLMAQAPDALLVPERVTVRACLLDPAAELTPPVRPGEPVPPLRRDRIELGAVFELSRASIAAWRGIDGATLPAATVTLPPALAPRYAARLMTRIDAFGPHGLDDYESSLNLPQRLPGRPALAGGERLTFHYRLGSEPGLACRVEPAGARYVGEDGKTIATTGRRG